jgi:hypothetical protein
MEERVMFNCRMEELTFIAVFLLISMKRDKTLFKSYSPVYDDKYIAGFETQKDDVEALVNPSQLTGEMKAITTLVAADYTKVRNMLNRVEDYLKLTEAPLTMGIADFGIRKVREQLESKNDEGIVRELRNLFQNLENNKTALEPVGYTTAISAEFKALIPGLTADSVSQTSKKDSRIALTQENIKTMNKLWKTMDKVMESGKKIGKEQKNSSMIDDYTYAHVLKKVRLQRQDQEPKEKK